MNILRSNPSRTEEFLVKYELAKRLVVEQGYSLTKAARQAGIKRQTLSRDMKEEGFEIINHQNATKFNESVFDQVNNKQAAYWLGFLYADGSVSLKRNTIELSLKSSDIGHLEKFRNFLEFKSTKHIFQDDIRCRLQITNKHLKQQLIQLGCTPQKSLTLKFPTQKQVPKEFHPHFIRGYVDGDGSVMINTRRNAGRLSILGTENMLQGILEATNWKKQKICLRENIYSIEWNGSYVTEYLDYLYKNANVYLDRKYKKYLQIKDIV